MRYPVSLTKDDNDTYLVRFRDVPEAITFGSTKEEALAHGLMALLTAFDARMKDRMAIPEPSLHDGPSVELPPLETAKVCLYATMRAQKIGKAELAKRLDWHLPQVDRVLSVKHGSQLDQMSAAFGAMGKELVLTIRDKATATLRRSTKDHRRDVRSSRQAAVHGSAMTSVARSSAPAMTRASKKR